MLEMAIEATYIIFDPTRLGFVALGVLIGLGLGIIPGLGGVVGLSLLLPFTFDMNPYTALAFLVGLQSVVVTSDTIPAVLFGVPGTVGSAPTILDGFPLAKKGLAAKAFGVAFSSSVIGGLLGAAFLALSIPILRPLVLSFGSPELLAFCIFGLSLVGILSGGSRLKGLAAAAFGVMVAMFGEESNTATERWVFDTLYLLDGVPLVPFALGLFAIPELADMAINRKPLAKKASINNRWDQVEGIKDTIKHIFLVIRCSGIGSVLGAIPGIGASVIGWIAYGHAMQSQKGASETFGKGDVRGIIASESSNNAKEGGALISTIAFGVPATAGMALLLGAFLIHGINPGPDMLTTRLDVTYTLVWTIAIANILGSGICFLFADRLADIIRIRVGILVPIVLSVTLIGAFQGSNQIGDLFVLLFFGIIGWIMKRADWPRPPLLLGFVLGGLIERYMFISYQRYEFEWLSRPIVIIVLCFTLYGIAMPLIKKLITKKNKKEYKNKFTINSSFLKSIDFKFNLLISSLFIYFILSSYYWELDAKLVPLSISIAGLSLSSLYLFLNILFKTPSIASNEIDNKNIDESTFKDLSSKTVTLRAIRYFIWCSSIVILSLFIGLLPSIFILLFGYIFFDGKESLLTTIIVGGMIWIVWYFLFHHLLYIAWPASMLGDYLPFLRSNTLTNIL